ncbi:hypothetical protein T01_4825 [Trichinella spiralis]|uniref:Uncharacterized protein n=1 Tax=Trichinella spiralis TaxID=6334 RepID=A0A0V1BXI7_TRISP|nr:hypothetical protein T01_4825 [Trichinella spiralis]
MLLRDVTNGQYAVNIQLVIRSVHLDMMDFFSPSKVRTSKHQVDTRSDQDERKNHCAQFTQNTVEDLRQIRPLECSAKYGNNKYLRSLIIKKFDDNQEWLNKISAFICTTAMKGELLTTSECAIYKKEVSMKAGN